MEGEREEEGRQGEDKGKGKGLVHAKNFAVIVFLFV